MKGKKVDRYTWRKRGYRKRRSEESIQDGKYSAAADAIINRNNGLKTRPFARNTPLDQVKPVKYGMVSIERKKVELRFREVTIATKAFGHFIENWHCRWLIGKPNSAHSVRLFFYADRAILVRYDHGVFERSNEFSSCARAMQHFERYDDGLKLQWHPFDVPLDEVITPLDGKKFPPSTKPLPIRGLHKPWRCAGCDGTDCENCKEKFLAQVRSD